MSRRSPFRARKLRIRLAEIVVVLLMLSAPTVAVADPPPVIVEIQSTTKFYACGERVLALYIEDMQWPPTIKLVKLGEPEIVAEHMNFDWPLPDGQMQCVVEINDQTAGGLWSVVVTNPDNQSAVLQDAIEVVPTCPKGRAGDLYVASDFGRSGVDNWWPEGPGGPPVGNPHFAHGNVLQFDGVTGDFICSFAFGGGEDDLDWLVLPQDLTWGSNGNLFVGDARHVDDIGNLAEGGKIIEYDGQTGEYVRTFVPVGSGGLGPVSSLAFGGPNGNLFVLWDDGSTRGALEYDGETGSFVGIPFEPTDFVGRARILDFGPNGNMLLASYNSGSGPTFVELGFDSETGDWELVRVIVHDAEIAVRFGFLLEPDMGSWLIGRTGFRISGVVDRVDVETGEILETVVPDEPPELGQLDTPWDVALGPGGDLFVSGNMTDVLPDGYSGALHQYDTSSVPFERVQVFAFPHDPAIEGEVHRPRQLGFKPLPGDYGGKQAGGDWDVDLDDCASFSEAFTGPGVGTSDVRALVAFDSDRDGDIDFADFGAFQRNFNRTVEDDR